jgi:hypothetical protein
MSSYAGIGSRETPRKALKAIRELAEELSEQGHVCRSGGAPGADTAFLDASWPNHEIFLPWPGFENCADADATLIEPMRGAFEIAKKYHPAWHGLTQGGMRLHARNSHILLGKDLTDPVDFVICWTPLGKIAGGTGQGMRIALDRGIPIINLGLLYK